MILPPSRTVLYNGITLQLSPVSSTPMLTWELERVIESFLSQEDDRSHNIQISLRHDAHLLDCQRPPIQVSSTLGIHEEACTDDDDESMVDPPIHVHYYEATTSNEFVPSLAPHREWTRVKQDLDDSPGPKINTNTHTDLMWVDLRCQAKLPLERPADCCHFLRSLLGVSHIAHPWGDADPNEFPVVCVVLPAPIPKALLSFRTTDACPSYFLHSICQIDIPNQNQQWWKPKQTVTIRDLEPAILFVYRRLPPRVCLMVQHPMKHDVPIGCLVESYTRQRDEDLEDDDDNVFQQFYRPVAPPFLSMKQDYSNLMEPLLLTENFQTIRQEAMNIPQWTAWPERQHYSSKGDSDEPTWTVFPLCHCFPANIVENRTWIDATSNFVPQTVALLKEHLGDTLRTALFSRLEPESTLEAHTGWEDLANHVYRLHLPLVVPNGEGLCGAWVDGCVETHKEGRPLVFDDSKVHRAFNYSSTGARVVLILDLARPVYLPIGTATGGHTDELDSFINSIT